ncbi:hypothetical protein [Novosphingobium taihuense]|uniref:Uncharacterized protein n=1 Tax=Novosphingobium taihuense TaxID=260085 RepID=A0A7W7ADN7_9SPHN|nr:hypothetical protein [Novosphingobium taihuense]MBB4615067.1 hypothetical protein [Novosphingobium taihuense]TWH79300.1 hypothetical protein IQ25_04021 [Novosphingobium taihuense]
MSEINAPQRGDFQWLGMSGSFEPSVEGASDPRGYFGLVPEATYPWGTFRDEEGKVYIFMRRFPFDGLTEPPREAGTRSTIGRRAVLFVQNDAGELHVDHRSIRTGYNTDTIIEVDGEKIVWHADEVDEKRRGFHAVYRPDRLEYREDGLIDIAGPSLKPGLQWYLPGRDNGLFYTSQTFACEGTILGKKVTGFLFIEQAYMKPDGVLYMVNDVLVGAETHLTWYSFATEYEGGEFEFGHFIVGHDRLGIGVVSNQNGLVVQSSTVSAKVSRATDGWSERVDLDVDGQAWEIIQPVDLRILPTAHTPNRQQEGMVRRVGETRKAVRWMAWGETAHGEERNLRYAPGYRPIASHG